MAARTSLKSLEAVLSKIQSLIEHIQARHQNFQLKLKCSVSGGCINQAFHISSNQGDLFLKVNTVDLASMFEAEYYGLLEMKASESVSVPEPLLFGSHDSQSYLLMTYLDMNGPRNWKQMGQQLAQMHRCTSSSFGWDRDNTIGVTPQLNTRCSKWVDFFRDMRLKYQIDLARKKGLKLDHADELLDNLDHFFDEETLPSLLHGDLWSGNIGFSVDGSPILFDPATHYGDRECDLAMTEMFGGFPEEFYKAYGDAWPLGKGYEIRKDLYQLYHFLNHFNLFGGGYGDQSEFLINKLIKQ